MKVHRVGPRAQVQQQLHDALGAVPAARARDMQQGAAAALVDAVYVTSRQGPAQGGHVVDEHAVKQRMHSALRGARRGRRTSPTAYATWQHHAANAARRKPAHRAATAAAARISDDATRDFPCRTTRSTGV